MISLLLTKETWKEINCFKRKTLSQSKAQQVKGYKKQTNITHKTMRLILSIFSKF